ncbi:MAG: DUF445 family protein [Lentisphaeria bacterium]
MNKTLQRVDFLVRISSWLTIIALCFSAMLHHGFGLDWGQTFFPSWFSPVATAAAVGYLTNYIAIWLLFKPYQPHWGIQGVIPREKGKLAIALGEQIPRYLLKPDELADQLGKVVKEYLQNQELLEEIRTQTNRFLSKYSISIADFLLPYLEQTMNRVVRENLTAENLSHLYDQLAADWFSKEENTERLATAISEELQKRAPYFSEHIRKHSARLAKSYFQQEYPTLTSLLSADKLAEYLIDNLNWERIEEQIVYKLEAPETRAAVQQELTNMTIKLQQYLHSPQAAENLKSYLSEKQKQVEDICRQFLAENIPGIVDQWLRKDEFWHAVEQRILPLLQALILRRLESEKMTIIEKFKFSEKIENSVHRLDMEELHGIINKVSGEHLVSIQLLGYGLGAIAGGLLFLTRMHPGG